MNTTQINRYNENGSENLDYWFGVRPNREVNEITVTFGKPRYTRYTLESLKKRSTERLSKMYYNLFGKTSDRQTMIANLYYKLNAMWNSYDGKLLSIVNKNANNISDGKRGRKAKFEATQIFQMFVDYEDGLKLTAIAQKYNTNIATVSQTLNCKGTYAYLFEDDYADELEIIQAIKQ